MSIMAMTRKFNFPKCVAEPILAVFKSFLPSPNLGPATNAGILRAIGILLTSSSNYYCDLWNDLCTLRSERKCYENKKSYHCLTSRVLSIWSKERWDYRWYRGNIFATRHSRISDADCHRLHASFLSCAYVDLDTTLAIDAQRRICRRDRLIFILCS